MANNKQNRDGKITVLEPLAATGLRSIRYLKEIDDIKKLVSNDIDPMAVELIKKNMDFNDIDKGKYQIFDMDAVTLMN